MIRFEESMLVTKTEPSFLQVVKRSPLYMNTYKNFVDCQLQSWENRYLKQPR